MQLWRWMYGNRLMQSLDETADAQDGFSQRYRWALNAAYRTCVSKDLDALAVNESQSLAPNCNTAKYGAHAHGCSPVL